MNELRKQGSPEATDELWSLANEPNALINTYSGCICNGVRFHTIHRDNRHKTQNSGLVVEGDHEGQPNQFYGFLTKVWEMTYLFNHRVVLFQCEWFNTGSSRTLRVDAHCTSIDVRSRWYKDDPFVLPSQVQQVFYVNDTKLGDHWKIVERIQRRGIWNVPERDNLETNGTPTEVFQQDTTTEISPIVVDDPIAISLRRNDIESEIVSEDAGLYLTTQRAQPEDIDNETFICDDEDEDEVMGDFDDEEEEEELHSDSDVDTDVEP
jgi:hypothetical protein